MFMFISLQRIKCQFLAFLTHFVRTILLFDQKRAFVAMTTNCWRQTRLLFSYSIMAAANGENIFIFDAENARQFQKLLDANCTIADDDDNVSLLFPSGAVKTMRIRMKCENCDSEFPLATYREHRCQYDHNKQFIFGEKDKKKLWDRSLMRQLLQNNNRKLETILRDNYTISAESSTAAATAATTSAVAAANLDKNGAHYVCKICKRLYVHASGLMRHMETHKGDDWTYKLASDNRRTPNVKIESRLEVLRCNDCNRLFSNLTTMLEHRAKIHYDTDPLPYRFEPIVLETMLQCEFCDFLYESEIALLDHESGHDSAVGFQCTLCDISCATLMSILQHRQSECPSRVYERHRRINLKTYFVCHECSGKFETEEKLFEHRYSANHFIALYNQSAGRNEFLCEKCGEAFMTTVELMQHSDEFHIKKRKPSEISAETISSRPYLCDICGKGYTQSSHLYQHLRFHKGIKPFECTSPGCSRRFTIRPDLNDHIRKCHTGERPYQCTVCNKTFLTGSVYYQHRLIHRGERRYGCSTCEKRFHRSDALKNHERIHSGLKPYACGVCPKSFRQKGDRDKHFRSRHGMLVALTSGGNTADMNLMESVSRIRPVYKNINGIDILTMVSN